jgi:hypothetical protein
MRAFASRSSGRSLLAIAAMAVIVGVPGPRAAAFQGNAPDTYLNTFLLNARPVPLGDGQLYLPLSVALNSQGQLHARPALALQGSRLVWPHLEPPGRAGPARMSITDMTFDARFQRVSIESLTDGICFGAPEAYRYVEGQEQSVTLRVAGVTTVDDLSDPGHPIFAYAVRLDTPINGETVWMCGLGPDGTPIAAIPVPGVWNYESDKPGVGGSPVDSPADQFTFACVNGALGKCLQFGYGPWKTESLINGVPASMTSLHQSCTRMVRGDYCGDGTPRTFIGMSIVVDDNAGINRQDPPPDDDLEANWGPWGAVKVGCTRSDLAATLSSLRNCNNVAVPEGECVANPTSPYLTNWGPRQGPSCLMSVPQGGSIKVRPLPP